MSGFGREVLPDVRVGSGSPPRCPAVVGVALPDVRVWSGSPPGCPAVVGVALPDVREWSGGLPGCPGVIGRTFRMSGSGRESLLDVLE